MLFLTKDESVLWQELGRRIVAQEAELASALARVRGNLKPVFYFYCGTRLVAAGRPDAARRCFAEGALLEEDGLFSNGFLSAFLGRHEGRLEMPAVCFADPQPFVHFTTTPQLSAARRNFIKACGHSLPDFARPFAIMDVGTGNGALVADLLRHLTEIGRIKELDEVLLIDPSPAMLELAERTVSQFVPRPRIRTLKARIQEVAGRLERPYDVALNSLVYHHMPYEHKARHLAALKPAIDHFIIFEIDADNDTPELASPELALSVYQSYGRIIDFIFRHDAPIQVAQSAIDNFLMTEEISFLTQPRGVRTDYHMLRRQWIRLCDEVLAPEFACRCDSDCYSDEYVSLFALHYGK